MQSFRGRDPALVLHRLSIAQRDALIEHANGPQPFEANGFHPSDEVFRNRITKQKLIDLGLLMPGIEDRASKTSRPKELELTDPLGRTVCCMILSQYADTLSAITMLAPQTQEILRKGIEALAKRQQHEAREKRDRIIEQRYFDDPYHQYRTKRDVRATDKLGELLKTSSIIGCDQT